MHEFKPEQVKRYLAREVIGALPNAAAIDLSQFAGLFDADARDDAEQAEGGEYRELLAALRSTPAVERAAPLPGERARPLDRARRRARPPRRAARHRGATPSTPLAGQRCEFDLEDGDGRRRVVLQAVVPGRRYVVGKGEGCDIRVNGTYASRRHAEIWLEQRRLVGRPTPARPTASASSRRAARSSAAARRTTAGGLEQPLRAGRRRAHRAVGARRGAGERLPVAGAAADRPAPRHAITPIAARRRRAPKTPLTAILPARPAESAFTTHRASQASGARTLRAAPRVRCR